MTSGVLNERSSPLMPYYNTEKFAKMEINGIYSSPFFLDISTAENEDFTTRLFELILILEKKKCLFYFSNVIIST